MDQLKLELGKQAIKIIRRGISSGDNFTLSEKDKNKDMFLTLGLVSPRKEVKQIVLELTEFEYCAGPEKDDKGRPDDIFKFRKKIQNEDIYIKIGYRKHSDENIHIRCISFHRWGDNS